MGKVSHSVCIALLVTVVNSFPLEEPKDTYNSPHVLIAQPPTLTNDSKDHLLPRESTSETNRPIREEPKQPQPAQNGNQGSTSTPKPVHHYRDGPIIQRRNADKSSSEESSSSGESNEKKGDRPYRYEPVNGRWGSSEESSSSKESDESHEKKNSETPNRQRRDTRDEKNEDNQSTYEKSHPAVLASDPNIQRPAYLPTPKTAADSEDQKVSPISISGPSSQYGPSTSSGVPDLIPASSSYSSDQHQDEKQTEDQKQQNTRDQQYNHQHPLEESNNQNRKVTDERVTSENQQQRKTRDLTHSQNNKATDTKHDSKNQQQKNVHENPPHLLASHSPSSSINRKVRDVNDNQPHLLASNPSNLGNRDDSPSSSPRSTAVSSSTTENTRFSNSRHVE